MSLTVQYDDLTFITEHGVQLLLDHLKASGQLAIEAVALPSLQALGTKLQEFSSSELERMGCVVRHSDNPCQPGSYHMTAVYLERAENAIVVLVLDSKGIKDSHYAFFVAKKIQETLGTKPYVLASMRQPESDTFRCPAYSVVDLVRLSKQLQPALRIVREIESNFQSRYLTPILKTPANMKPSDQFISNLFNGFLAHLSSYSSTPQ